MDWARQAILHVRRWAPKRKIVVVVDSFPQLCITCREWLRPWPLRSPVESSPAFDVRGWGSEFGVSMTRWENGTK
jgi:hypothetical protein